MVVAALQRPQRLLPQLLLPHYKYNINFYVFIFSNASLGRQTHTHIVEYPEAVAPIKIWPLNDVYER